MQHDCGRLRQVSLQTLTSGVKRGWEIRQELIKIRPGGSPDLHLQSNVYFVLAVSNRNLSKFCLQSKCKTCGCLMNMISHVQVGLTANDQSPERDPFTFGLRWPLLRVFFASATGKRLLAFDKRRIP